MFLSLYLPGRDHVPVSLSPWERSCSCLFISLGEITFLSLYLPGRDHVPVSLSPWERSCSCLFISLGEIMFLSLYLPGRDHVLETSLNQYEMINEIYLNRTLITKIQNYLENSAANHVMFISTDSNCLAVSFLLTQTV